MNEYESFQNEIENNMFNLECAEYFIRNQKISPYFISFQDIIGPVCVSYLHCQCNGDTTVMD